MRNESRLRDRLHGGAICASLKNTPQNNLRAREDVMKMKKAWTTPHLREIAVGMEINAYACAEIRG